MAQNNIPSSWDESDELEGYAPVDKGDLVGVAFRIFSVRFEVDNEGRERIVVAAELTNGDTVEFQDYSRKSGVKAQIADYLAAREIDWTEDEDQDVSIVVRGGLRFSEYDTPGGRKGERSRTYYLVTTGRKVEATKPEPTRRARKTAAPAETANA